MKNLKKIIIMLIVTLIIVPCMNVNAQSAMKISKKTYIYTGSRKEAKFYTNKGYAYCITPHKTGASQGTSLYYKSTQTSGGVLYLLEKAGTSNSSYLATQLAIWKYNSNYMPDFYLNHSSYEVVKKAKSLAEEAAKNKNYQSQKPSVSINLNNTTLSLTSDGNYYKTGVIVVNVVNANDVTLTLEGAPEGATIVDSNNNIVSKVNNNAEIYVQIPTEKVNQNITFTIKAIAEGTISKVERYAASSSKWQELVTLVKEKQEVTTSKELLVVLEKRVCEFFNGKYYGKDGKETTKEDYTSQCEKHICEKVGDTYYGKDGKETTKENYTLQCEQRTCEKVGDTYFGKNGMEVSFDEYVSQCEKHICEFYNNKYYGSNGLIVSQEEYKAQCEKEVVPIPDTGSNPLSGSIFVIIGSLLLGATGKFITYTTKKE